MNLTCGTALPPKGQRAAVAERAVTPDYLLVTCEHGGNRIPAAYRRFFSGYCALLDSHRGFDAGALVVATELAVHFGAPLVTSNVSRLLVDLNRSIDHPHVFSELTRAAPVAVRDEIEARHYRPYRARAEHWVRKGVASGKRVVHISSHSFTPELHGKVRSADIGLLYDPARAGEVDFCARWKTALAIRAPALRVRRNYPYAGKGDGLAAYFRSRFPPDVYVGIELEVNQNRVRRVSREWSGIREAIVASLRDALARRHPETATPSKGQQDVHP